MKTIINILLVACQISMGYAQYSNGSFLSMADFSLEETMKHAPCPDALAGTWVGSSLIEYDFHPIGNAYLATKRSFHPFQPGFQKGEVKAVVTYAANGQYQFAIRDKSHNGGETVVKILCRYEKNLFIDESNGHIARRISRPVAKTDAPISSKTPLVPTEETSPRKRNTFSDHTPAKSAAPSQPARATTGKTSDIATPKIAGIPPKRVRPKSVLAHASKNENHSFQNKPERTDISSQMTDRNHIADPTSLAENSAQGGQENRYFKDKLSKKKIKKKSKGTLGKILKGAGKLVVGAASVYSGTAVLNALKGKSKPDDIPQGLSQLAQSLNRSGQQPTFGTSSGVPSSTSEQELLKELQSLLDQKTRETSEEDLMSIIGALSQQNPSNSAIGSMSPESSSAVYIKNQIESFQKNYGHLLDKLRPK